LTNKLKFAVEDIHLLQTDEIDKNQFSLLRVDAFATGRSLHDTFVTEETLRKTAKSILQKPFVFAIDERFNDLGTHDPKEVAGGFVPHNSNIEFKKLSDGRLMMSCDVLIWKRYSGNLLNYFRRDDGRKSVSVEVEIYESREDPTNGLLELLDFAYTAITGLGDMIQSAIPNAEAVMAFAKEYEKDKILYEEFSSKYEDIDFTIPSGIKNSAKKALESKKGSSVALAMARFLSNNEKATPERIKQIFNFFKNKKLNDMDEIVLNLYGGKQAYKWSKELFERVTEIDSKKLSYFGEEKSLEEELAEDISPLLVDNYLGMETEDETINMAEKEEKKLDMAEGDAVIEKKDDVEAKAEEKEENKKFSYAEIFGMPQEDFSKMFADEDEDDEDTKTKFASAKEEFGIGANPSAMMAGMFALIKKMATKMAKDEEDKKVYMAENEELKSKFAEIDKEKKEFAVTTFLKELSEKVIVPEDKYTEMKNASETISFAELDKWKNDCKAISFDFALINKSEEENETSEIIRYAFPFGQDAVKLNDDVWSGLNK